LEKAKEVKVGIMPRDSTVEDEPNIMEREPYLEV